MITRRSLLLGPILGITATVARAVENDFRAEQVFTLGDEKNDAPIRLIVRGYGRGPAFFAPHENEDTSVQAALPLIQKFGGTLVEIKQSGGRNITFRHKGKQYEADPNRIFTDAGIEATLKKFGPYSKEVHRIIKQKFVGGVLSSIGYDEDALKYPVIALHNNTPGSYSLASYEQGGEYAGDAANVASNGKDKDNFFFVTDSALFHKLADAGFNVVLQDNKNAADDGSLSIYCGRRGISYVNVEAETGQVEAQKRMLTALYQIIKTQ